MQWLRDGLGLISDAGEAEALATSIASTEGVVFVPALTGLGSPHWDPDARGLVTGLTRGTTRAHLVRATLEAIAFQVADVLEAYPGDVGVLRADGGATRNRFLMQFQSDLLGCPVEVAADTETTALGAAALAGLAVGTWADVEASSARTAGSPLRTGHEPGGSRRAAWRVAAWTAASAQRGSSIALKSWWACRNRRQPSVTTTVFGSVNASSTELPPTRPRPSSSRRDHRREGGSPSSSSTR